MIMDKNRMWILGSAIVMVGVLVLGWFIGIQPQLAAKALNDVQRYSVEAENDATEAALAVLKADFDNIEALRTELATLRGSIPAVAGISAFLTEVQAIQDASDTTVTSISVADPVPYTAPATAVVVPDVPAEAPVEGAEAEPAETTDAVAPPVPAGPVAPVIPTDPAITEGNFVAIPITLAIDGSYANALNFVEKLQHGKRLFMVTQFTSNPGDGAGAPEEGSEDAGAADTSASSSVTGYIYALLEE